MTCESKLSENKTENEILKLIRCVDQNFKSTLSDFLLRGGSVFPFVAVIVFFVLIEVFLVFTRSLHEQIVVATSFLALVIGFSSLVARFGEEHIVDVNFKRLARVERVEENERPLLKALIKMKIKHQEIDLEQIYNMNENMFTTEKLLEKLYE